MAVYTHLTADEIKDHLTQYDLGELVEYRGIQEGIENSNFFVRTTSGKYILTLFEKRVDPKDLPFFVGMMDWLEEKGIQCPRALVAKNGERIVKVKNHPSIIITFLEGKGVRTIRNTHMALLGDIQAKMHLAAEGFSLQRENSMSLAAWKQLAQKVVSGADVISPGLSKKIEMEIMFLEHHWPKGLPSGVIHADLFPDNVFYIERGVDVFLSGVIDFYFACNDYFMYDLAICMNAWCFEHVHYEFNITRAALLLRGYNHIRPLTSEEMDALPILARGSALRFLLTRTHDWLHPVEGALVKPKNPDEYIKKLHFHQRVKSIKEYGL